MSSGDIILDPAHDEMQLVHFPATILKTDSNGQQTVWRGDSIIAYEYGTNPTAWIRWLSDIDLAAIPTASILYIESGFCTLARILGPTYAHYSLYAESVMSRFIPPGAHGLAGDWKVNIASLGTFDFILFDIGPQPTSADKDILVPHLKPEGLLLQP